MAGDRGFDPVDCARAELRRRLDEADDRLEFEEALGEARRTLLFDLVDVLQALGEQRWEELLDEGDDGRAFARGLRLLRERWDELERAAERAGRRADLVYCRDLFEEVEGRAVAAERG